MHRWVPQSIIALRHYNRHTFISDAIAGVTVGLVALPLAMAFAISSGMAPQAGIYCAIVAGFLTAALGGSMTAIGGPTGAFVVVVAGIIGQFGVNGLFLCTMMAGIILIALGASGVGSAVKYIPRPVVVGFTNGIAVLIASTQLRDFFGLRIAAMPDDFIERMRVVAAHFSTISWPATALGIATRRDRRSDAACGSEGARNHRRYAGRLDHCRGRWSCLSRRSARDSAVCLRVFPDSSSPRSNGRCYPTCSRRP